MQHRRRIFPAILIATVLLFGPAGAETDIRTAAVADYIEANVRPWLDEPAIINAILAQNGAHARLGKAGIEMLDARWRAELSRTTRPMIEAQLSNPLSLYLKGRQRAAGP